MPGPRKMTIVLPKTRAAGSLGVKPFGQSSTSAPDTLGDLRRAKQMLAGTPTAVRIRNMAPKIKPVGGLSLGPKVRI